MPDLRDTTVLRRIEAPNDFFAGLGRLHDARIETLQWSQAERRLSVAIDDLQSNSLDLPGYSGPQPAVLVFVGVRSIALGVDPVTTHMSIFGVTVKDASSPGVIEVEIALSPGGKLRVECEAVDFEEKGVRNARAFH